MEQPGEFPDLEVNCSLTPSLVISQYPHQGTWSHTHGIKRPPSRQINCTFEYHKQISSLGWHFRSPSQCNSSLALGREPCSTITWLCLAWWPEDVTHRASATSAGQTPPEILDLFSSSATAWKARRSWPWQHCLHEVWMGEVKKWLSLAHSWDVISSF